MWPDSYTEISQDIFFSKGDTSDPRLGDIVKGAKSIEELSEGRTVLIGYPDDEGISLNGGRLGATQAPDRIRRLLYKMTPSLSRPHSPAILDFGNLKKEGTLSRRHEEARDGVRQFLKKECRVVTLGGGHDYGFPDTAAFCDFTLSQGKRPFVINFDAHLDVRGDSKGFNSGTPFYRLLKEFSGRLDFFEVGIQDWCNSKDHLRWAEEHGAQIVLLDDIFQSGKPLSEILFQKILSRITRDHRLAISIDIDGFESSSAPGASQVFPIGIDAKEFLVVWRLILNRYRPLLVGVYEVSPPLDQDDRTSRLAALLIHQFLCS